MAQGVMNLKFLKLEFPQLPVVGRLHPPLEARF